MVGRVGYRNGVWVENDKLVGINLGSDCVAEHQFGIEDLTKHFRLDEKILGLEGRKVNIFPETFLLKESTYQKKRTTHILFSSWWMDHQLKRIRPSGWINDDTNLATSWDGKSFKISAQEESRKRVKELYKSFKELDGFITMVKSSRDNPFETPGLFLGIASNVPDSWKQELYDYDYDLFCLNEKMKETGIEKLLEDAGKNYYSLSPKWKDTSKTDIIFYLSVMGQSEHNGGWFDLDDLKLWAIDQGPVPKEGTSNTIDFMLRGST